MVSSGTVPFEVNWERIMPLKDPEKRKSYNKKYREEHREQTRAATKAWYVANREAVLAKRALWHANNKERRSAWARKTYREDRERIFFKKYGVTLLDYYIMLEKQGYQCPICQDWLRPRTDELRIDHCHVTNKVRGIPHHKCNLLLGLADDNVNILTNAINYLSGRRGA
jgi:hypothetical protein